MTKDAKDMPDEELELAVLSWDGATELGSGGRSSAPGCLATGLSRPGWGYPSLGSTRRAWRRIDADVNRRCVCAAEAQCESGMSCRRQLQLRQASTRLLATSSPPLLLGVRWSRCRAEPLDSAVAPQYTQAWPSRRAIWRATLPRRLERLSRPGRALYCLRVMSLLIVRESRAVKFIFSLDTS